MENWITLPTFPVMDSLRSVLSAINTRFKEILSQRTSSESPSLLHLVAIMANGLNLAWEGVEWRGWDAAQLYCDLSWNESSGGQIPLKKNKLPMFWKETYFTLEEMSFFISVKVQAHVPLAPINLNTHATKCTQCEFLTEHTSPHIQWKKGLQKSINPHTGITVRPWNLPTLFQKHDSPEWTEWAAFMDVRQYRIWIPANPKWCILLFFNKYYFV